jgi:hypothetical protein
MTDTLVKIGNWMPNVILNRDSVKEVDELLVAKFEKGLMRPIYVPGAVVSHLGFDSFVPLSICGMKGTRGTSSSQTVTAIGAVCPVCKARYSKVLQRFMVKRMAEMDAAQVEAEAKGETFKTPKATEKLRTVIKSRPELFELLK